MISEDYLGQCGAVKTAMQTSIWTDIGGLLENCWRY
jgi:hypothetical protein